MVGQGNTSKPQGRIHIAINECLRHKGSGQGIILMILITFTLPDSVPQSLSAAFRHLGHRCCSSVPVGNWRTRSHCAPAATQSVWPAWS
eukprot:6349805-Pyramimonas_sp.AAC.1